MKLLICLVAALPLDILAYDFFMAMTPHGTAQGAFGPTCTAPSLLFDRRDSFTYCSGGHTFDGLHHLGWTIRGHRLHEEVHMLFLRAKLQANHGIALGALQTDLCEHRSTTGVKHHASILGRTDERVHEDRNIRALMAIFAHTSANNGCKQAKQAAGNLTPRD